MRSDDLALGTGARRAALLLHGLGLPDRDWLLAQLDLDERSVLEPLLLELADLGVPPLDAGRLSRRAPSPTPARRVAGTTTSPAPVVSAEAAPAAAVASPSTLRAALRTASARAVARRLAPELDAVAVQLLAEADDALRRRVLRHLEPTRRGRIRAALAALQANDGARTVGARRAQALHDAWTAATPPTPAVTRRRLVARLERALTQLAGRTRGAATRGIERVFVR